MEQPHSCGSGVARFLTGFPALLLLTVLAYLWPAQSVIKYYNLEYPLWGLFVGMLICNTANRDGETRIAG